MATIRTVTVKSSGGDYASLNAALAGESADLVALDRQLTIECYAMQDTTAASTGTGYTTDATRYIHITTPVSARHAGIFTTAKYYMNVASAVCVAIKENFVRVSGLQFSSSTSTNVRTAGIVVDSQTTSNDIRIYNNIFRGETNSGDITAGFDGVVIEESNGPNTHATIFNNILYGYYLRSYSTTQVPYCNGIILRYAGDSALYNNTVYKCCTCVFIGPYGTITVKNNLAARVTSAFSACAGAPDVVAYNASDDGTADDWGGTGNRINQTFTFVDAAGGDFHLASTDAGAKDYGVSDPGSGLFSDDIDGVTRSGSWDIGADEYASGAPASYSITGAGAVAFSGGASIARGRVSVATGALVLAGAAAAVRGRVQTAAGALVASGTALTTRGRVQLASGGLQMAAAATIARGRVQPATGAVAFAGAASVARAAKVTGTGAVGFAGASAVVRGRVQPAVGALAVAGTAAIVRAARLTATGAVVFGGAAAVSTTGSFAIIGAGGLTLAAAAALARGRSVLAAGAVTLQASAAVVRGRVHPALGQVTFAGTASISTTSGYTIVGAGGVTLAGTATIVRGRVQPAIGVLALAGAAALTRHRVVGAAGGVLMFGGAATITSAGPVLTYTLLTISRHGVTRHVGGSVRMTPSAGGRVTLTPSPGDAVRTWLEE